MSAGVSQAALFEDKNLVGVDQRRQAVADDHHGTPRRDTAQVAHEDGLALRV